MRRKTINLILAVLVTLPLIFSCARVEQNTSLTTFVKTLLTKNVWTMEDRQNIVNTLSVNALNKLLDYFDANSVETLYSEFIAMGALSNTKYEAPKEKTKLTKQVGGLYNVYHHVWLVNQQAPVLVYYVMEKDIIEDIQLLDAKLIKSRWSIGKFIGALLGGIFVWYWLSQFLYWLGSSISGEEGCGGALVVVFTIALIAVAIAQGVEKTYASLDGRKFDSNFEFAESPYPGPADRTCANAALKRMNDELSGMKDNARGNESLAETFAERGRQSMLKADVSSLLRALNLMERSVQYNFDNNTVIDIAKIFTELALQDVQPELNRAKALTMLRSPVLRHRNFVRKECVLSLVLLVNGQVNQANKHFKNAEEIFTASNRMDKATKLSFYEANYFFETDHQRREEIADELILLEPDNVKYYYLKAVANFAAGNDNVGRRSIERGQAMNSNYTLSETELKLLDYTLHPRYKRRISMPDIPEDMPFKAIDPYEDVLVFVGGSFEPIETEAVVIETAVSAEDDNAGARPAQRVRIKPSDATRPFAQKGLVGVWKMRKTTGRKTAAVIIYLVLLFFVVAIVFGIADEFLWESGTLFFNELLWIAVLYFLWWGVSGTGSWIWMGATAFVVGGIAALSYE